MLEEAVSEMHMRDREKISRMLGLPTGGMSVLTRSSIDTGMPVRTYAPITQLLSPSVFFFSARFRVRGVLKAAGSDFDFQFSFSFGLDQNHTRHIILKTHSVLRTSKTSIDRTYTAC